MFNKSNAASLLCPQCGKTYDEPKERCDDDGVPLYGPEVMARIGAKIGNYRIERILGEGGMGVVYGAKHDILEKPVAVKILHDRFARRAGAMEQFLREARAASQIQHQNIVDVTDFGTSQDGSVYFVMEHLEGISLEDILARDARVELFKAVNIVRQLGHCLAAAHEHGIAHLDLKPENIYLVNREGRRKVVRKLNRTSDRFVVEAEGHYNFVKLLDFGVAKFIHDSQKTGISRSRMVFGTPHYMSPEQAKGAKVDGRSDIYSLGIVFYEMLTGQVPFDSDNASDILNAHVSVNPTPPNQCFSDVEIGDATNSTIMKCLEKNVNDRFQNMDEFIQALQLCFTDRVFLRDAHLMPGAAAAGIHAPNLPTDRYEDLGAKKPSRRRLTTDEVESVVHEMKTDAYYIDEPSDIDTPNRRSPTAATPTRDRYDEQNLPPRPSRQTKSSHLQMLEVADDARV